MKEKLREQQHVDGAIEASTTLIGFYTGALEEAVDQIKTYVDDGNFAAALGELKQVEETEIVEHLRDLLTRRRELQERSDAL